MSAVRTVFIPGVVVARLLILFGWSHVDNNVGRSKGPCPGDLIDPLPGDGESLLGPHRRRDE